MSSKWMTSVNLDEETAAIAKSMPNRSAFIRECLRRWANAQATNHIHPTESPRCYPHSRNGVCPLCWPNGIPSVEDWKYYREMNRQAWNMEEWIDERIESSHSWNLPTSNDLSQIKNRPLQGGVKRSFRGKIADRIKALFRFG